MRVVVTHTRGFTYGENFVGVGQVINTKALPNDGRLIEMGFFTRYDPELYPDVVEDRGCEFITDHHRLRWLADMEDREQPKDIGPGEHMLAAKRRDVEEDMLKRRGMVPGVNR